MLWVVFIFIGIMLVFVYLLLIRPSSLRKDATKTFAQYRFAHRGLHDAETVENTLDAFEKAKDAGYGVELDVRFTKDKKIVVFHDDSLIRSSERDENIENLTYEELSTIQLFGKNIYAPLFSDILANLKNVPLLVELKCDTSNVAELAEKTATLLDAYQGSYAIESFNPLILSWFKTNRPNVLRGQLVTRKDLPKSLSGFKRFILSHMLLNGIVRPDFIAVRISETDALTFRLCRVLYHPVLFGWTVKSEEDYQKSKDFFDTIIFEIIRP